MKTPTVAVTGVNAKPENPGPGLAVARCLRESPGFTGRILGLGYDVLDPGLYLREWCDGGYLIPYPSAGEAAVIERLQAIQAIDPIDILIPCLDAELLGFARLKPELERMGIHCLIPSPEQLTRRSKDRLGEVADKAGLAYPRTEVVTNAGWFYDNLRDGWSWPLVVKGQFYDAVVVRTPEEAAAAFRRMAREWGVPVLVQEYIVGEEINLTALGDGRGGMLAPVMMSKRAITEKGKAWAGISIWDERLLEAARELVAELRWPGPLEVEVIRDHEGTYHLVEVNPRFPAWIYLSHGVGRNLPRRLVDLLLGLEASPEPEPVTGCMFVRYASEILIDLKDLQSMTVYGRLVPGLKPSAESSS